MMDLNFKRCSISDAGVLSKLGKETFYETFADMNDPETMEVYLEEAFSEEQLREEFRHPGSLFYLLNVDGEPAGYLKINEDGAQTEFGDADGLEIERIYLKQALQGRGLGRALMEKAISIAREKEKSYIWLGVWTRHTRAVAFYEHMGFEKAGSHYFLMGAEQQKDHIMRIDL